MRVCEYIRLPVSVIYVCMYFVIHKLKTIRAHTCMNEFGFPYCRQPIFLIEMHKFHLARDNKKMKVWEESKSKIVKKNVTLVLRFDNNFTMTIVDV